MLETMSGRVELDSKDVTIVSQIQYQRSTSSLCIWTVRSYSKLNEDVLYYQTNDTKYTLKLMKTSHTLFVSLYCSFTKLPNVKFLLIGSEDETYGNVATEIKPGVYVAEFYDRVVSDPKKNFLANDTITIHCICPETPTDVGYTVVPYGEWRYKCCSDDLRDVLEHLYNSSDYSDCTVTALGDQFKVHTPILVARSKYFARKLTERLVTDFKIPFFKSYRLGHVLRYIYTGELKEMSVQEMAEICLIADYLEVNPLSSKCEAYLKSNLDYDNFIKILITAAKCGSKGLIKEAIYYFIINMEEFKKRTNYEDICKSIRDVLTCKFNNIDKAFQLFV